MARIAKYVVSLGMVAIMLLLCATVFAAKQFTMLVPPQQGHSRESVQVFHDQQGNVNLAYATQGEGRPGELYHLVHKEGVWSSPVPLSLANGNFVHLYDVETLADGTPLMLLSWDRVDYLKLFNITIDPSNPPAPNTPFPVPQQQLLSLMDQNRQLFYRLYINSQWTDAIPIPGTFKVKKAVLKAGPDNSALVIFWRDHHEDPNVISDDELYAMTFNGNHWSQPVRLTTNTQMEANVQIAWVGDRYLIVWAVDQDNDFASMSDKQLRFATMGADGTILSADASVTSSFESQGVPYPILGSYNNGGVLLWISSSEDADGQSSETVWQQKFSGSWTQPEEIGISLNAVRDAKVFQEEDGLLAVLNDGQRIWPLYYNGAEWTGGKEAIHLKDDGVTRQGIDFTYSLGTIDVGLIARAVSGVAVDPNAPGALYHAAAPVLPDLTIAAIADAPSLKKIGQNVTLALEIVNTGGMPSSAYSVDIHSQGALLKTVSGESLLPGKSEALSVEIPLEKPYLPLDIRVTGASPEVTLENNEKKHVVRVLPDYRVLEVKKTDAGAFLALMEEAKGLAASPVAVDAYLTVEGVRTRVAQTLYDPRRDDQVAIDGVQVPINGTPYQLEVRVNDDRKRKEDRYDNNTGSYIYDPKPDFVISSIEVVNDQLQIVIESQNVVAVDSVKLIVTDDPSVATQDAPQTPLPHTETISFQNGSQQTISIDLSGLSLEGSYLYVVVNPYGAAEESDYNNNLIRFPRQTAVSKSHQLVLDNPEGECGRIEVTVANNGSAPAVYSYVELYDEGMNVVARKTASGIDRESFQRITFANADPGTYLLRLIDPARESKVASELSLQQTSSSSDEGCMPPAHSPGESPDPNEPQLIDEPISDPPSPSVQLGYSGCSLTVGPDSAKPSTFMLLAGLFLSMLLLLVRRRYA